MIKLMDRNQRGLHTNADRDTLFEYLSAATTSIFSEDIRLSNNMLNKILTAGESLFGTMNILKVGAVKSRQSIQSAIATPHDNSTSSRSIYD